MSDARSVVWSGDAAWVASSGGLFRWQPATNGFLTLTPAEGLRSIDLTAVGVDRTGAIWSGSSSGALHIYNPSDGSLRTVTDILSSTQTSKSINAIQDFGDTLLVSTEFGLSLFRLSRLEFGDTFTHFGAISVGTRIAVVSAALFSGKIWAAITDRQSLNGVAVGSLSSPNLLPPESWDVQTVGLTGTETHALEVFNGRLYAGTSAGLYVTDGGPWTFVSAVGVKSILVLAASADRLLLGTGAYEVVALAKNGTVTTVGGTLPALPLSIAADTQGNPLVAISGGGVLSSGAAWTTHYPNGPNANRFVNVTVDDDGRVWGACGIADGKGMYCYDGKTWTSFTTANSALPFNEVYRVSVACGGNVWGTTWGRGVVEIPRGTLRIDSSHVYNANVGMVGIDVAPDYVVPSNVVCDSKGNAWTTIRLPVNRNVFSVRTASGAWRHFPALLDGNNITFLTDQAIDHVLAVDAYDNIWGAVRDPSFKGLISLYNAGTIDSTVRMYLTSANGLPSDNVTTVVVDKENDIWVGTDKGIAIILDPLNPKRKDGIAAYKPLNGLSINTIAIDPLNQKWVGTTEGVILLSPDGTQVLAEYSVESTAGKLVDNDVKSIAVDPKTGTVYFGCAQGLSSLSTAAAAPKADFDELFVYPNPFLLPSASPLTIDGLVEGSRMKILAADGTLVRDLSTPGGRIGFWDGRDDRGRTVASGIYFIVGYSGEDGSKVGAGKVAVVRK